MFDSDDNSDSCSNSDSDNSDNCSHNTFGSINSGEIDKAYSKSDIKFNYFIKNLHKNDILYNIVDKNMYIVNEANGNDEINNKVPNITIEKYINEKKDIKKKNKKNKKKLHKKSSLDKSLDENEPNKSDNEQKEEKGTTEKNDLKDEKLDSDNIEKNEMKTKNDLKDEKLDSDNIEKNDIKIKNDISESKVSEDNKIITPSDNITDKNIDKNNDKENSIINENNNDINKIDKNIDIKNKEDNISIIKNNEEVTIPKLEENNNIELIKKVEVQTNNKEEEIKDSAQNISKKKNEEEIIKDNQEKNNKKEKKNKKKNKNKEKNNNNKEKLKLTLSNYHEFSAYRDVKIYYINYLNKSMQITYPVKINNDFSDFKEEFCREYSLGEVEIIYKNEKKIKLNNSFKNFDFENDYFLVIEKDNSTPIDVSIENSSLDKKNRYKEEKLTKCEKNHLFIASNNIKIEKISTLQGIDNLNLDIYQLPSVFFGDKCRYEKQTKNLFLGDWKQNCELVYSIKTSIGTSKRYDNNNYGKEFIINDVYLKRNIIYIFSLDISQGSIFSQNFKTFKDDPYIFLSSEFSTIFFGKFTIKILSDLIFDS